MSTMLSDKVEQVGGATGDSSSGSGYDDIRNQFRAWKDDVIASLRSDKTWGGGEAEETGVASHTREALTSVKDAVRADAVDALHCVEDYVIDHPLKALGVAVGVGFLLGVIWSH
jgi:ElaB/YqjD/DUF883 family membrane-anchored ribosome-binding protein